MSSMRQLKATDLFDLWTCNLDPLTETYDLRFYLEYFARWPTMCYKIVSHTEEVEAYILGKVEASPHGKPSVEPYSPDTNKNLNYLPWHGHITALTVAPKCRRLGHAKKLTWLLETEAEKKNCWFVDLFVRSDNEPAISLYKSLGYSVFRRVKDYYSDGQDALDMRKPLSRDKNHQTVREDGENYVVEPHDVWGRNTAKMTKFKNGEAVNASAPSINTPATRLTLDGRGVGRALMPPPAVRPANTDPYHTERVSTPPPLPSSPPPLPSSPPPLPSNPPPSPSSPPFPDIPERSYTPDHPVVNALNEALSNDLPIPYSPIPVNANSLADHLQTVYISQLSTACQNTCNSIHTLKNAIKTYQEAGRDTITLELELISVCRHLAFLLKQASTASKGVESPDGRQQLEQQLSEGWKLIGAEADKLCESLPALDQAHLLAKLEARSEELQEVANSVMENIPSEAKET